MLNSSSELVIGKISQLAFVSCSITFSQMMFQTVMGSEMGSILKMDFVCLFLHQI